MIEVNNFKILNALPSMPEQGEMAYCTDEETYYTYDHGWKEIPKDQELNTGLTLYDLNKTVIAQLPDLTKEQLQEKIIIINNYVCDMESNYFMLLSNEMKYYTVFSIVDWPAGGSCGEEVLECLEYFDCTIKSIELLEDGSAIEIWIKKDNEVYMMYFFNYEEGVVECHR